MIGELIGALVGRHIDEADGSGGAEGAAIGAGSVWVASKIVPVALGFGLLFAGFKLIESQYNKYNKPDA